jgi:predicted  nucleic acid-binding Zn-ribbon protein
MSKLLREAAKMAVTAEARAEELDVEMRATMVEIANLRADIERLRSALAFYADRRNYEDTPTSMGWVMEDEGETAREALSEKV